jgi:hypothetical protein
VAALRNALLALHKELLDAQRVQAERISGRMSAAEVLQAAAEDLRFDWLRSLSELVGELDEALSAGETAALEAIVERTRALLAPPAASTPFGARYLQALQAEPAVVFAHRVSSLSSSSCGCKHS